MSLKRFMPCNFTDNFSAKQVKAFCLQKSADGLALKKNHAYYYQVQLQMGVCEVQWGYFVVWTPLGLYTEKIIFGATFLLPLLQNLPTFIVIISCQNFSL